VQYTVQYHGGRHRQIFRHPRVPARGKRVNLQQQGVVHYPTDHPLVVAAGAGSGKTTAITTRALKEGVADRRDPSAISLTTFTKRRWPSFAPVYVVRESNQRSASGVAQRNFLTALDINRFVAGPPDHLAEQGLGES
jgi:hypothetical protein|tara:strand:- start:745 stop:1155 length:411 start_codon:yes stop_codon:yes gene_type:complete